jgi:Glutaredoxin-like domain (DUF836)
MPLILLNLYSTSHCHLCDLAISLVNVTLPNSKLTIIEIANDDNLLLRYGVLIPVLQREDNGKEINWPFTANDVLQLANL